MSYQNDVLHFKHKIRNDHLGHQMQMFDRIYHQAH